MTSRVHSISEPVDTTRSIFDLLGGEPGVRALVDRFYDLMDIEPDLKELRAAHGPSLDEARDKLFWFLCGYFGGPDHYIERFGHPGCARAICLFHRRGRARSVGDLHGARAGGRGHRARAGRSPA